MDLNPEVNPTAAQGFGNTADSYERGRPEYPKEAVDYLVQILKIGPRSRVLDLGAGTGKFTRLLVPTQAHLTAVEPVEAMRAIFVSALPGVECLVGNAEKIPASESTFDVIVSAQAFHWFDAKAALLEMNRVLKPNGKVGLVWNLRDDSIDWVSKLSEILSARSTTVPRYGTYQWKRVFDQSQVFTPLEKRSFKYRQKGTKETVMDLVRSRSYVGSLRDEDRKTVLGRVGELLENHPQTKRKEEINIPYVTDVYWCSKK
jgi:ubiquinone/menaquinone biosynthesis C-methylase UbiE